MSPSNRRRRGRGLTNFELLVVIGVLAILLTLGFFGYRHARLRARVSVAESRLKQVGTGLDLYFNRYGHYPPQGANLTEALAEFVDATVCENPLGDEAADGETVSLLYVQPSAANLDRPNQYLTAMADADGTVAVMLLTGGKVVSHWNLGTTTGQYDEILASLLADTTPPDTTESDGIKYICVKGKGGIVYQSTYKRLGSKKGGKGVTDSFAMKITDKRGRAVTLPELMDAKVKVDIHSGNKNTFSLPPKSTYGDLRDRPVPLVDPDSGESSGWSVQFEEREGAAHVVVQMNMDLTAGDDLFQQLTRIWVDFPGFDISVPDDALDGNKYFATRR
jgi:type II secretory pathway pseudopilin PulG